MKKVLILLALVLLAYAQSVRHELLRYDDAEYVLVNKHMRAGLTPANVRWAVMSCGYAANWHPLAWLSLMADVSVDRLLRGGAMADEKAWMDYDTRLAHLMHAHNVVLHAVNAALLMLLVLAVCRGSLAPVWAFLLALLWAVHPLRVEVVCWVAERKELLSVMFMLLTLIAYVKDSSRRQGLLSAPYVLSLLFYALALLAKPVAVSLPAVIFAWDWIFGGRVRWRRFLPFAALSAAACALTMMAQTEAIDVGRSIPLAARLTTVLGGPLFYLRQTFWPVGLSAFYPVTTEVNVPLVLGGAALVGAMAWVSIRWLRRRERLAGIAAFAVAWLYVGLLPMLGVIKVGTEEHSDRYTYWIGCGAAVVLAQLIVWLKPRREAVLKALQADPVREPWALLRRYLVIGGLAVAAVLGCLTQVRQRYWRDSVTLFRDAVSKSWMPEAANILAFVLRSERIGGGAAEAEWWLRECATRRPSPDADLALAEFLLGKTPEPVLSEEDRRHRFLEEEDLIRRYLEADPNGKRAKELLKRITDFREGKDR